MRVAARSLPSSFARLTSAARMGGGDADMNPRLRGPRWQHAKNAANMPSDTIQRAIKKVPVSLPGEVYEEITYEGYGAGGCRGPRWTC